MSIIQFLTFLLVLVGPQCNLALKSRDNATVNFSKVLSLNPRQSHESYAYSCWTWWSVCYFIVWNFNYSFRSRIQDFRGTDMENIFPWSGDSDFLFIFLDILESKFPIVWVGSYRIIIMWENTSLPVFFAWSESKWLNQTMLTTVQFTYWTNIFVMTYRLWKEIWELRFVISSDDNLDFEVLSIYDVHGGQYDDDGWIQILREKWLLFQILSTIEDRKRTDFRVRLILCK